MNLKRQLLLVSLLTLVLPWAGCEFIRETESALRQSQQQMLSGTAGAVAESLERYPEEFPVGPGGNATPADQLYGHRLDTEPFIDGYVNDWSVPLDSLQQIRGADGPVRFVLGLYGRYAYFYAAVTDRELVYASPSTIAVDDGPAYADRVVLVSANPPMASESLMFSAEAPGPVIAWLRSSFGFGPEPTVQARWQDVAGGYQVEARIPLNLLGTHLGVNVINTSSENDAGIRSTSFSGQVPGPFVTISPDLTSLAERLVQPGTRMLITDRNGWRIAAVGSPDTTVQPSRAGCGSRTKRSWNREPSPRLPSRTRAAVSGSPTSRRRSMAAVPRAGFAASRAAGPSSPSPNPFPAADARSVPSCCSRAPTLSSASGTKAWPG